MNLDAEYFSSSNRSSCSNTDTTPSQRKQWTSEMTEAAKKRVDKKAESKGCLIENVSMASDVQYVHCLARSTDSDTLDKLEFIWGMKRGTLNVDTRYNVMHLGAKFHTYFDQKQWLLLPDPQVVEAFYDLKDKRGIPEKRETYNYTLIAHPELWRIPIYRQTRPSDTVPSAEYFQHYSHPYHNFPSITSHVKPEFVICNAGPKLKDLVPWQKAHPTHFRFIAMVQAIWFAWDAVIPTDDFIGSTPEDRRSDMADDSSERTRELRRRPRPAKDGNWLDSKTLHELDQQFPSSSKQSVDKTPMIRDWLSNIENTKDLIAMNDSDKADDTEDMALG